MRPTVSRIGDNHPAVEPSSTSRPVHGQGVRKGAPGAYLAHWAAVMELPVEEHKVAAATSET